MPSEADPLISVIVPSYNEAETVCLTLSKVLALPLNIELIVVDDGSQDNTLELLERLQLENPNVKVLKHPANRGKGAAVRTAIPATKGSIVVIQDADLEYDPNDLPSILQPIIDGYADVVYGSRLRGGQPQRAHMFWHYAGNRALSLLTNLLYNTTISDMEVGYKAFKGDIIRSLTLVSNDFRIEPEITAKVLKIDNIKLYEVPISYYGRSYEEGKKITWRDGYKAVATLVRFRLKR